MSGRKIGCQRNKGSTDVVTRHLFTSESSQQRHPTSAILLLFIKLVCARHTRQTDSDYIFITFSFCCQTYLDTDKPGATEQKPVRTLTNVALKVKLPESKRRAAKRCTDLSDRLQQSSGESQRVRQKSAPFTLCSQGKTVFFFFA